VLLLSVTAHQFAMPPPWAEELPDKVLLLTASAQPLSMPPP